MAGREKPGRVSALDPRRRSFSNPLPQFFRQIFVNLQLTFHEAMALGVRAAQGVSMPFMSPYLHPLEHLEATLDVLVFVWLFDLHGGRIWDVPSLSVRHCHHP